MSDTDQKAAEIPPKQNKSFEAFLRRTFKGVIDPVADFLLKIGLTPNFITSLGMVFSTVVAVLLAAGHIRLAGVVMLVTAPTDVLDGSMARLHGGDTVFGAFFDSVTDRYAELVILGGLLIYYLNLGNKLAVILAFVAAMGSVLVSYVKARAEGLGLSGKTGIMTRVERVIITIGCFLFNIPMVALWLLSVLTLVTVFQRFFFVRKQAINQ